MRKNLLILLCALWCINYTQAQVSRTVNVSTPGTLAGLIDSEKSTITDLTVTGSINATDFAVFRQMSALKNLDLGTVDCEEIPSSAFSSVNMDNIVLPIRIKIIRERVFEGIKIPKLDFSKCTNLEEIGFKAFANAKIEDNTIDLSKNQKLTRFPTYSVDFGTFYDCSAHVILSDEMTELPARIFKKFRGTIKFPKNLKSIGAGAFIWASFEDKLIIPTSVEIINNGAFDDATLKQGMNLSELVNLRIIKENVFANIKTPKLDFSGCTNLEEIGFRAFTNAKIEDNTIDLSKNQKLTRFPAHGTNWGTFYGSSAHVILSDKMTELPTRIFQEFRGTIKFPKNLEIIGGAAFASASFEEKLIIPTSVEIFKDGAFESTTLKQGMNLSELVNLRIIKENAFFNIKIPKLDFSKCTNLEEIGFRAFMNAKIEDNTVDLSKNQKLTRFPAHGTNWGTFFESSAHVILSDKMTELPTRIFQRFRGTIKLPKNLKTIKLSAFNEASIKTITIFDSVSYIEKYAFNACKELVEIRSLNPIPPVLDPEVFEGVDKENCILYVPRQSLYLYATADQWKDFLNIKSEGEIPLYFSSLCESDSIKDVEYTGIRIGEYLWTNSNLNHAIPNRYTTGDDAKVFQWNSGSALFGHGADAFRVTQNTLDRYMPCHLMDPAIYQLEEISMFEKYYGIYYNYYEIQYMSGYYHGYYGEYRQGYGRMKEGINKTVKDSWKVPSQGDFAQLFAMCDFGGNYLAEQDVEFALGAKLGDNPLAKRLSSNGQVVGWFDGLKNTFGFNLMPSGGRFGLAPGGWENGLPNKGHVWAAQLGDLYHLFQAEYFHTMEDDGKILCIGIHDALTFYDISASKWQNTRYCRRLTPEELGYELYINDDLTDIIKINPTETPPNGYERLRNGYLRGFYVKYILDNPNPTKTIADILELTRETAKQNTGTAGAGYPKTEEIYLGIPQTKTVLRNALGVEKKSNKSNNTISVYPNPVVNTLNIDSEQDITSLSIINSTGSIVKSLLDCNKNIDVSDLPSGIYILRIETKTGTVTNKMIKQ